MLSNKAIGNITIAATVAAALFFGPLALSALFWSVGVMAHSFRAMVVAIVGY